MASRTQRSWPVMARYVKTAAKARFPMTRLMPLSMRLPPPPKKGPLPAPAAPSRSRCRPAVLQGKAPLFPTNSARTDGPAVEVEQDPFENLGGSFLNLGKRKACEQQQSGGGARRAGLSKATEAKGLSLRNCSSKFNFFPHLSLMFAHLCGENAARVCSGGDGVGTRQWKKQPEKNSSARSRFPESRHDIQLD